MNIYERLRRSRHKNNNQMDKEMTITELVEEINQVITGKKINRNVINRIESSTQEPSNSQLVAYSKVFDVSIDYILGNTSPKSENEIIKSTADFLNLSDTTIENISKLSKDNKLILDKMISKYCLLLILPEMRNLLGYNYLRPHLTLKFEEKRQFQSGAEIDQVLNNAINDNAVSSFFNEAINTRLKTIIDNTMNDDELREYFGELDRRSKLSTAPLPAEYLPKFNNTKGSD